MASPYRIPIARNAFLLPAQNLISVANTISWPLNVRLLNFSFEETQTRTFFKGFKNSTPQILSSQAYFSNESKRSIRSKEHSSRLNKFKHSSHSDEHSIHSNDSQENSNEEDAPFFYKNSNVHVVLVNPQIPGNAGSIARTCAATSVGLHLIEPLGFQIDDSKLKRAGLDYWPYVVVKVHSSWKDFFDYFCEQNGPKRLIAFSKFGRKKHTDFHYQDGDWLLFGSETNGLSDEVVRECKQGKFGGGVSRIPIIETHVRSLNLSVSVGVALYEALRQINPPENPT